jgi:GH15 family glucan-1,4-alpha-glucosidase
MNKELYSGSIKLILENQSEWGSYVASPTFPTYQYCWLRDGSFIAYAMDTAGEYASAAAFFRWVGRTIQNHGKKVEGVRLHLKAGIPLGKDDFLHTRFTLDGNEVTVDDTWGNFQIDGYGTWLWALAQHVQMCGDYSILTELAGPIQTTLKYLELVWKLPNYDCWEEFPEYLHPYSLATVFAGFDSIASLVRSGHMQAVPLPLDELAEQVKEFIWKYGIKDGRFVKHILPAGSAQAPRPILKSGVDSSLLGISVPFNLISPQDPIMQATLEAIETDLHRLGGGLYRYKADVFYGGGEWIILTAWLGWYYTRVGKMDQAEALCGWIESQADAQGNLPEQVSAQTLFADQFEPWLNKWGPVACPLTWSHAAYILLVNAIREGKLK